VPKNAPKTIFLHEIKTTNVTKETLGVGHVYSNERMDAPMDSQTLPTGSTRGQDQLKKLHTLVPIQPGQQAVF